jgi:hypothetical protein
MDLFFCSARLVLFAFGIENFMKALKYPIFICWLTFDLMSGKKRKNKREDEDPSGSGPWM